MNPTELRKRKNLCKQYKKHVQQHAAHLQRQLERGTLSHQDYQRRLHHDFDGKHPQEWVRMYDKHIMDVTKELRKLYIPYLVLIAIFIVAITLLVFRPSPTDVPRTDVTLTPNSSGIDELTLRGLPANSSVRIETPALPDDAVPHEKVEKAFALNTADYDNGTAKIIASGTQLWKCRQWDDERQLCAVAWELVQDIQPGGTYTLRLERTDNGAVFAETSLNILNVQSYPMVGGDWTVRFTTIGRDNLTIEGVDNTTFGHDLRFLQLWCEDTLLTPVVEENRITYPDYACAGEGRVVSRILTYGRHHLKFTFGNATGYANNLAGSSGFVFFTDAIDVTPTAVGSWTAVDVSANVPEGATGVVLALVNLNRSGNYRIVTRHPNSTNDFYTADDQDIQGNGTNYMITAINSSRAFNVSREATGGKVYLVGYTDSEVVLFQNIINLSGQYAGTGVWRYLNVSGNITSDAEGVIVRVFSQTAGQRIMVKANGSTTYNWSDSQVIANGFNVYVVKHNDRFIMANRSSATGQFQLLGYIKGSAPVTLFIEPINISQNVLAAWVDTNVKANTSAKANGAFVMRKSNTAALRAGMARVLGSSNNWYSNSTMRNLAAHMEFVGLDSNQTFQQEIQDAGQDYMLFGYTERQPYPPNLSSFNYPPNQSVLASAVVPFNFTVLHEDGNLTCTLWGNFSGSWAANLSVTNVSNNTATNITITVPDGSFAWNVNCTDWFGQYDFYDVNYTLRVDTLKPTVSNAFLNESVVNQSHRVLFNVTVTDNSSVSVNATLLYPNGTTTNLTLQQSGTSWLVNITNTNETGQYNITYVFAGDEAGNLNISTYDNLTFNVTASPPAAFSLLTPPNQTISSNVTPQFTWQQSQDETFLNYTLLIDNDTDFSSPAFTRWLALVTNVSYAINESLAVNTVYYWRVTAYDVFGSSATADVFTYTTDTSTPTISLHTPADGSVSTSFPVLFSYTPTDTNLRNCTLYANFSGSFGENETNTSPISGAANNFTITLADGNWVWNVLCRDAANLSAFASSNFTLTVDTTSPVVQLESPPNNTYNDTTNNILLIYNVSDVMGNISSCIRVIDGQQQGVPDTTITEDVSQNFTAFMDNNIHNWSINCTDTSGLTGSSPTYNISVNVSAETDPPLITLTSPDNATYVTSTTVVFNYTPNDLSGIENCSLYLDDVYNQTNDSIVNQNANNFTATLSEVVHTWMVSCYDNLTFVQGNSTTKTFTVDSIDPFIQLHTPVNNTFETSSPVLFNYTPTDTNLRNCTLYANFSGSFLPNATNASVVSGVPQNFTITLADGSWLWNVYCVDAAGRNVSATDNFTTLVDANAPVFQNIVAYPSLPTYALAQNFTFNVTVQEPFLVNVTLEHNLTGTLVNTTVTSATALYSYNITDLAAGAYTYRWHAVDQLGRTNDTTWYEYTVQQAAPALTLLLNGTAGNFSTAESTTVNITGLLTAPADTIELYLDGDLLQSGTSSLTNISTYTIPGTYNVTLVYAGNQNYTAASVTWFIQVNDTIAPVVNLMQPVNNSYVGTTTVTFQYNVSDSGTILNCSLYINSTYNQTDTTVSTSVLQTFDVDMANSHYWWNVTCWDTALQQSWSVTYNFTVQQSAAMTVNVSANLTYPWGSIANFTVLSTDSFAQPLSDVNVTTNVILGNTTVPWWNLSWQRRKPILVTNNYSNNLTNVPVHVNMSGLDGNITSCLNESRVADGNGSLVPLQVIDGDNATWCDIRFLANITASASNESRYFYYYNNSQAASVSQEVRGQYALLTADFEAGSNFLFSAGACAIDGTQNCTLSNPWDGFSNCSESEAGANYGICSSNDMNARGNRGLEARGGLDRNVANGDGLYYLINRSACGGVQCNNINLSYYQAAFSLDNANEGSAVFVNDSDGIVWMVSNCTNGEGCEAPTNRVDMGNVSEFVMRDLCAVAGITCSNGTIRVRFTSALVRAHDTTDYFGWDAINFTGYVNDTTNITATPGAAQKILQTDNNLTNVSGLLALFFDTLPYALGNYSVVGFGMLSGMSNATGSARFQIVPDTVSPGITLVSPENDSWYNVQTLNFSYLPVDSAPLQNCTLVIDGSIVATNDTVTRDGMNNFTYGSIAEGGHNWSVNCTDYSNNTGSAINWTLTIDLTLPNATVTYPGPLNQTNDTTPEIWFLMWDERSPTLNYTVYVNGIAQLSSNASNNTNVSVNVTVGGNGNHTIIVQARDRAGNKRNSSNFTIILDQQVPTMQLYLPPANNVTKNQTVLFNFSYRDNLAPNATCRINVDTSTLDPYVLFNNTQYTTTASGFLPGNHTWNVSCTDVASNTGTSSRRWFVIDLSGPTISLTSPSDNRYSNSSNVTFNFTVTDVSNIGTCWLVLNNTKNTSKTGISNGSNFITVSALPDSEFNWSINCTDSGNNEGSSMTRQLIVDTIPPASFSLTLPGNQSVTNSSPTFTWQASSDSYFSNYTVHVDDSAAFSSIDFSTTTTDVTALLTLASDTIYFWHVLARDLAGNLRASENYTFTTDASAPVVTLRAPPDGDTDPDGNVTFFYTASDVSLANCTLYTNSSGTWTNMSADISPGNGLNLLSLTGIADGTSFIWNVQCFDGANRSAWGAQNWSVTISPPLQSCQNYTLPTLLEINGSAPIISGMDMLASIDLYAGTTRNVSCSGNVTDPDGIAEVTLVNATFYHVTSSLDAADDASVHYSNGSCACTVIDPISENCTCSFDIWYVARNGTWTCALTAMDAGGASSGLLDVNVSELYALNISDGIDYGSLAAQEVSDQVEANITNLGNVPLSVQVLGYGVAFQDGLSLVCNQGQNISVGLQRFSANLSSTFAEKTPLAGTPQSVPTLVVNASSSPASPVTNSTYWQLQAPDSSLDNCTGYVVFTATAS